MSQLIKAFQLASQAGCLAQHEVAREAVFLLRSYQRILPMHLQSAMAQLGLPRNFETGELLASWLQADGWAHASATPFAGRGMSAVQAYEPSEKWKKLVARVQVGVVELDTLVGGMQRQRVAKLT
jgi:hypothetical protein